MLHRGNLLHPNKHDEVENGFENRNERACNADTSLGKVFDTKLKRSYNFQRNLIGLLK
jgi:hypothetical protein